MGTECLLIDLEGTWIILSKAIVWFGHRIPSVAGHPGCLVWLYAVNRKKWVLMNDWHRWRFFGFHRTFSVNYCIWCLQTAGDGTRKFSFKQTQFHEVSLLLNSEWERHILAPVLVDRNWHVSHWLMEACIETSKAPTKRCPGGTGRGWIGAQNWAPGGLQERPGQTVVPTKCEPSLRSQPLLLFGNVGPAGVITVL